MKAFSAGRVLGVLAVLGGISGVNVQAQEEAVAAEATAAASVDVVSAYVFRGATINDEVDVQPTLEGTFHGVTLGTWGNLNTDSSQFDEIDLYASYDLPTGDCPVDLSIGYTEYTYPTGTDEEGAGLEADREVSLAGAYEAAVNEKTTLSTSLAGYYGIEGPFLEDGVYVEAASSLAFAACENTTVSGGVTVGAELGDNYEENGVSHVDLDLGLSYSALSAGVKYIIETDDEVLVVDEEWVGSVSLALPL